MYIRPSPPGLSLAQQGLSQAQGGPNQALGGLGGINGCTDGWMEILPCVLQDIVPFGSAALLHTHIINKILAGQGYR